MSILLTQRHSLIGKSTVPVLTALKVEEEESTVMARLRKDYPLTNYRCRSNKYHLGILGREYTVIKGHKWLSISGLSGVVTLGDHIIPVYVSKNYSLSFRSQPLGGIMDQMAKNTPQTKSETEEALGQVRRMTFRARLIEPHVIRHSPRGMPYGFVRIIFYYLYSSAAKFPDDNF